MQLKINHWGDLKTMLRALLAQGYTEEAIASAVKVSQSTISRILSGTIRSPKWQTAMRIQHIFQQFWFFIFLQIS